MDTLFNLTQSTNANDEGYVLHEYNTKKVIRHHTGEPVRLPNGFIPNKQEFRGVWITTIWNLDVPQFPVANHEQLFKEYHMEMFDVLESFNINAIMYQVRPKNDAIYPSEYSPWSRSLTGVEGQDPGWDPLEWLIEEAHTRGMEFHAWFNPYRVFVDASVDEKSIVKKHPEYVLHPAPGDEMLNPGIPEVQQFIIDVVKEVAENYPIDGVHFDDYFYPYSPLADHFDDDQYQLYNENNLSKADWRRENVDKVVKGIKDMVTEINERESRKIQYGISPFGVWKNRSSGDPAGSPSQSLESYSTLFADTKKWIEEEWIDYVVPQLYWEFTEPNAPYADMLDWWADLVSDTNVNLYIGHAIYRYVESDWRNDGPWPDPDELGKQLLYNSKRKEVQGAIYFRYKNFLQHNNHLTYAKEQLKNKFYSDKVLPPAVRSIQGEAPEPVKNLTIQAVKNGNQLTWSNNKSYKAYYVYRYEDNDLVTLRHITNVIDIVWPTNDSVVTYVDETAESDTSYRYLITAFDYANQEGKPSGIDTNGELITTM